MPDRPGWNRETATHFLADNANYKALRETATGRITPLADMSTQTLKRHASFMWQNERAGRWVRNYRELAGHPVSERHKGRAGGGLVKNPAPDYVPPFKKPRGEFNIGGMNGLPQQSFVRVTEREGPAVRSLIKAAGRRARGRSRHGKFKVTINITGHLPGQYAHLFDKGGWDAEKLLEAAGYGRRRLKSGKLSGRFWDLGRGKHGLEAFLLEYLADNVGGYGERWGAIDLYEIFAWSEPMDLTKTESVEVSGSSLEPRRVEY